MIIINTQLFFCVSSRMDVEVWLLTSKQLESLLNNQFSAAVKTLVH